ncbi:WRKY Transcription Factor [Ranunculus cassubicifolius]
MSDYSSLPTNFPAGDSGYTSLMNYHQLDLSDFEISDFLIPEASSGEDSTSTQFDCGTSNPVLAEQVEESVVYNGRDDTRRTYSTDRQSKAAGKKTKADTGFRVAFRTKSELEIMDDGYKWRKYGKKSVKNSPNPRNYYRCSHQGCHVKKRVERDREDEKYVITTYDGVHSHESPSIIYYNEMPLMVPNGWTLQASQSSYS